MPALTLPFQSTVFVFIARLIQVEPLVASVGYLCNNSTTYNFTNDAAGKYAAPAISTPSL
jgi:hypothetical protein